MIWSLCLGAAGVLSLWLAGNGTIWAWVIGLATQCVWVAYALTTAQYGFLISCAAFVTVYVRNWVKWSSERKSPPGD